MSEEDEKPDLNSLKRGFYDDFDVMRERFEPPQKVSKNGDEEIGKLSKVDHHPIPVNCVGLVIGKNGSEIKNIAQTTGCRVQVNATSTCDGYRNVEIFGSPENIDSAKNYIDNLIARAGGRAPKRPAGIPVDQIQIQRNSSSTITIEIPIPPEKCGLIIGKGGETMRKLKECSNCHVVLIQENSLPNATKPLRVTGTPEHVATAEKLITEILSKNFDNNTVTASIMCANGPEAMMTIHVKVPRGTVGAILGIRGQNVKKITDDTGTKIQFLPDDDPTQTSRTMTIMGTNNRIHVAAQMIKEIVEGNREQFGDSTASLFYMSIPASKCGLVIGRGGETIKQINAESGAYCELSRDPSVDVMEKVFLIKGTDRQLEHAKHLIRIKVGDVPLGTPFVPPVQTNVAPVFADPPMYHPPQEQLQQFQPIYQLPTSSNFPYQSIPNPNPNIYQYQYQPMINMAPAPQIYPVQPFQPTNFQPICQNIVSNFENYGSLLFADQNSQLERENQEKELKMRQAVQNDEIRAIMNQIAAKKKEDEKDYSKEWIEYYVSIGDHASADKVRARIAERTT